MSDKTYYDYPPASAERLNEVEKYARGINHVEYADQLTADDAQENTGEFIERTTGGTTSLSDGSAWLSRIWGNRIHTGYVAENITMTVNPATREEGVDPITATLDRDTFVAYVASSGTITLTYDGSAWSASPALYGVTVSGTPVENDEIVIVYVAENRGTITVATPASFKSTGYNLYNHTNGYARVLKYSETYGFIIKGTYTAVQFSETLEGTKTTITPDADGKFSVTADGYVWVTGGNNTDTEIYMTWSDWTSGYTGTFAAYAESTVNLSTLMTNNFPNGMFRVGLVRDEIDFDAGMAISRIERMAYSAANLATAKASGRAYEYDTNYIYLVRASEVSTAITLTIEYTAADHGMEFFVGTSVPVGVSMLYGQNLKDKLRTDVLTKSSDIIALEDATSTDTDKVVSAADVAALSDQMANMVSGDNVEVLGNFYCEAGEKARWCAMLVNGKGICAITGKIKTSAALTSGQTYNLAKVPFKAARQTVYAHSGWSGICYQDYDSDIIKFSLSASAAIYTTLTLSGIIEVV